MIALALKVLFWAAFATIVACIEIEAEGKHGWAARMPTWYRTTGWAGKLYGALMGGKPLTGYHLYMFVFPMLLFHAHFAMGFPWSAAEECLSWAMFFSWCVLWDYHWFVLNPHFVGQFRKDVVWWHAKSRWILGRFPMDYLVGIVLSILLTVAASWISGDRVYLSDHAFRLLGFMTWTAMLHASAPRYHRWYWRMRETDDRDKAGIVTPTSGFLVEKRANEVV
jgi:hypothetical protein